MTTTIIASGNTTYIASQGDMTYLLKKGSELLVGTNIAITDTAAANKLFQINGTVNGEYYGMRIGRDDNPTVNADIVVGLSGRVSGGDYGINLTTTDGSIINKGEITGTGLQGVAIKASGAGMQIDNHGSVNATSLGINLIGDNASIENSGNIQGTLAGALLNSEKGQHQTLINHGTISAPTGSGAVLASAGDDRVVNYGTLDGAVTLGAGNDTFVSQGGSISKVVVGGIGNDTFRIDDGSIKIYEGKGEGFDRVFTSASYTMVAHVEQATLIGKADINLYGTASSDRMIGNRGDNRLGAGNGMDQITGGAGNDRLTGGNMADTFIFKAGSGQDVITDFVHGIDKIDVSDYAGINVPKDLEGHISQVGEDAVVSLLNDDTIRLKHVQAADLTNADFQF